jgi:ABC-2 type transport system permease protein
MVGYLVGKIVTVTGWVLIPFTIVLIPGLFLADGLALNTVGAWLSLIAVLALGMLATLPFGAIIGSAFNSPRAIGFVSMPIMGLTAVSGIFYPITSMPGWVQGLAQVFPIYWLGLGMRSAMLPGEAVAIELGQSWRHWETVGMLGVWAIVGLSVAPIFLRRMARGESGSKVAARREKAMSRAY